MLSYRIPKIWSTKMKTAELHSEIQAGIINYLSIHPSASASVKGIYSEWLTNERVSYNIEQVQTALDRLVDHGEIQKRSGSNVYTL